MSIQIRSTGQVICEIGSGVVARRSENLRWRKIGRSEKNEGVATIAKNKTGSVGYTEPV